MSASALIAVVSAAILIICIVASFILKRASQAKQAQPPIPNNIVTAATAATDNNHVEDKREKCTILYGTQTGTSERFAKSLRSQLEGKYGTHTAFETIDIENYDHTAQLPSEKLVFLLMATYGDGDPVDSAIPFFDWLKEKEDAPDYDIYLSNLKYGVFGLGNKQYEHFAKAGKIVHKALAAAGATAIVRRGDGDDDEDIDADFDNWCVDLFAALDASPELVTANKPGETGGSLSDLPAYEINIINSGVGMEAPLLASSLSATGSGLNAHTPYLATISVVKELHTKSSDRSCVHVEVDIKGSGIIYEAGDHIAVFAENSLDTIKTAAQLLHQPLDLCIQLQVPVDNHHNLPDPGPMMEGTITLKKALACGADLLSAPSKAALAALAACAKDEKEAARLRYLASIEGKDEYHTYVINGKRSLLQVMKDYPSAVPSLGAFFGCIAPRLQPRYYSISSSPKLHPHSIHVTCAVVREEMPSGRLHEGVASCWLAAAKTGTKVPIFVRRSTFKLPAAVSTPVVMVGPGTGLAPFRGFIQDRHAMLTHSTTTKAQKENRMNGNGNASTSILGPAYLFYGCRKKAHDYIYQHELETAVDSGALAALHVAFSRDQKEKDYVQHHIRKRGGEIWSALHDNGGALYVCGDAKHMAKDVHRAMVEVAMEGLGGVSVSEAEAAIKKLSDSGRYLKDVW
jgi:NADPH-ferrihemoprotein reductase